MIIAPETPDCVPRIRALLVEAFDGAAEADLVDRLRHDGDVVVSLVARQEGAVVGHVLLSRMAAPAETLGLAPLAVAATHRRQGIGGALVRAAIEHAKSQGARAIFVLGEADYYSRFGFSAAAAAVFESHYAGPHFMMLDLGGANVPPGPADYAAAFASG